MVINHLLNKKHFRPFKALLNNSSNSSEYIPTALYFFSLENNFFSNRNDLLVAISKKVKRDFNKKISVATNNWKIENFNFDHGKRGR